MAFGFGPGARRIVCAGLLLLAGAAAGWGLRAGSGEAQENASALAEAEIGRFLDALSGRGNLADVLGDAFQLMRSNSTRYDRDGYLTAQSKLSDYKLSDVRAFQSGDVLTATFLIGVTGIVGGAEVVTEAQPRLAAFTKVNGQWKLQAFANFGVGLLANPQAEGQKAVEAWVGAAVSGDVAKIKAVLAPEFQIVRSDGSAYDAAGYLGSDLPRFEAMPAIADLVVTGYNDYLVARYNLAAAVMLGDEREERIGPRLTVFRKRGGDWLVVSHANFAAVPR